MPRDRCRGMVCGWAVDELRDRPFDVCDHLQRRLLDDFHALAVGKLAKVARCTDDQINAIDACLNLVVSCQFCLSLYY